ncbi:LysR substrate-binding domain-containing protein [Phenylobacterium sp.]|uniref:LysR family transcriptional regulator n=1 Tax=Phenylobacterium sp. TaxID=1871053 RepID=UPI0035B1FC55
MDLSLLKLFAEVAEAGGFAAAARRRSADPSSVSRGIGALEAELGVRLFDRTTRRLALSQAGELYLARIAPLIAGLERAADEVRSSRSDPVGRVRVTASVAFGEARVIPLLREFREAFPRLELELLLTDANLDLVADRVDVALRLAPSPRADVVGVKLFATRYRVVASPGYVDREGALASPKELADRACILFPYANFRQRWSFRRSDGAIDVAPVQGPLIISSAPAMRRAALDGLGPALLGDWLIGEDVASGRLIDLFPEHQVAPASFDTAAWLLYPAREHLPRRVSLAIDFFCRRLTA